MTDRELLEMAARAVKHEIDTIDAEHDPDHWECWNPLLDDGDALRLAVSLRLDISDRDDGIEVMSWSGRPLQVIEADNGDRNACTRRAIVRAAAEIGRSM